MKLEEANKLTLQQAVDFAMESIVKQGERCMNNTACLYGDDSGKHCAVGWLLDETDEGLMNCGGSITTMVSSRIHSEKIPEVVKSNVAVFQNLQAIHDGDFDYIRLSQLKEAGIDLTKPYWKQWAEIMEAPILLEKLEITS